MSGLLERILESKRAEVEALRQHAVTGTDHPTLDVPSALRARGALRLIAEVKRKSPSAGVLSSGGSASERARAYAGAAMVSVLCDGPFFGGSYDDLADARSATTVPLLAKEFVLDEVQVARAREAGADAVLVIVRILPRADVRRIVEACRAHQLEPFVEVADEGELHTALDADARVIGVNTRDLDTLAMDAARAERVIAAIPPDRVAVHLSGVRGPEDIARVARTRADAVLVGEALMREADPRELLKRMLAAAAR